MPLRSSFSHPNLRTVWQWIRPARIPTRAAAAVRRRGKNPYPDSPGLSDCEPCDNGSVQAESLPVRPLRPCAVEKRIPTQTPAAISNLEPCDNGDVQRAV